MKLKFKKILVLSKIEKYSFTNIRTLLKIGESYFIHEFFKKPNGSVWQNLEELDDNHKNMLWEYLR